MCLLLLLHQASTETRRAHGFGGIAVWPIQRSKRIEPASLPARNWPSSTRRAREQNSQSVSSVPVQIGAGHHTTHSLSTLRPTLLYTRQRGAAAQLAGGLTDWTGFFRAASQAVRRRAGAGAGAGALVHNAAHRRARHTSAHKRE